jgi:hypothetical protein
VLALTDAAGSIIMTSVTTVSKAVTVLFISILLTKTNSLLPY